MKQLNIWDHSHLPFPVPTEVAAKLLGCSKSSLSRYKRLSQACYGTCRDFTVIAKFAFTEKNKDFWAISWQPNGSVA